MRRSDGSGERACAIILTRAVGGRELVERRCRVAAAAGVHAGLDLAQARALIPPGLALHTQPHRADREAEALHRLACWALRISPTVAPDPPDGLLLDLTGTARLYGREQRVMRSALRALRRLGLHARIATAGTFACAAAVARYAEAPVTAVEPGGERAALAPLSSAALTDDPATLEAFHELGMDDAGQVLGIPRRQLASRFGLALLDRIDRALGHAPEPISPVHPPPPISAELMFEGPTDRVESIEAAAQHVLADLVRSLAQRQRGVRTLVFTLLRPRGNGEHARATIELSRASVNRKHLWKLLRTRLERTDLGAQVEGLVAVAVRTARLRHRQQADDRLGADDPEGGKGGEPLCHEAAGELTDTLVNRLGPEAILRARLRSSHLPERSFVAQSVMQPRPHTGCAVTERAPGDRPTRLVHPPQPVDVTALTPDGPVLELTWEGERRRILFCAGPERIGPEWWRWGGCSVESGAAHSLPPDRDYFAVQLDTGLWLWVCRQADTARWFIHGIWA